jgi:hypothetical protein
MPASSARRPAGRGICRGAAVAVALGLLLSGCSQEKKEATPEPAPTPIASLNTVAMQIPRIKFCGLVPASAVAEAVGGKPDSDASYGNGDEEALPDVGSDVVHEIGCSWTGKDGVSARAWVFARPISTAFARTVIASGRRTDGCHRVPGPAYGKPSLTQLCQRPDGEQRVRHAGLFGQTWLTCELTGAKVAHTELSTRADAWCVEVANALNTAR